MTREEQLAVCNAFNLGEPVSCKPLGGTRNRNYHLTTASGEFVVRNRYAGYCDPARIAFDHEAVEFLGLLGGVAKPYRTSDRQYVFEESGKVWEVFAFVRGIQFREGVPEQIRGLGTALSRFHYRGQEYSGPRQAQKLGPRGETDPKELEKLIAQLRSDAPREVKRYELWMKEAASELSDSAYESLPHSLIHGDVQPANVLMIMNNVSAFIDLDWCDWRPRIYDLAFAILLCCATHETPIDGGDIWSLSQAPSVKAELVGTFLQSYETEWPMSDEEKSALRAQTILSWCHVRLAGAMKVEPERRGEFLDRPPHDLAAIFPGGIS